MSVTSDLHADLLRLIPDEARVSDGDSVLDLHSADLSYHQPHRPDVVVLDLGLPGMSGIEVIEGLRGWTTVPIIVLSARNTEREKVAALDAGADDGMPVTSPGPLRRALQYTAVAGPPVAGAVQDTFADAEPAVAVTPVGVPGAPAGSNSTSTL